MSRLLIFKPKRIISIFIVMVMTMLNTSSAKNLFIVPFESQDTTLAPQVEEISRAATIAPSLEKYLNEKEIEIEIEIFRLSDTEFEHINVGTNFLYDKPNLVAKLAKENGVQQWAIVGRLYRPSHLFAYIQAKVIDVERETAIELLSVEIKGGADKLMQRGINRLAEQIIESTSAN